jgi:carboxyl-terminal processing protease
MKKRSGILFLIAVILVFFFLFGSKTIFRPLSETKTDYQYFSLISEVMALAKTDYVEEIDPAKKFPGAFSGMLGSLNSFSAYLDVRKTEIYRQFQLGHSYHCGIWGTKRSDYFYITDILPGSPAEKKGLMPGDMIKAINGKSTFGLSFWEIYLSLFTRAPGSIEVIRLPQGDHSATPQKIRLETTAFTPGISINELKKNIHLVELPRIDNNSVTALKQRFNIDPALSSPARPLRLIIDLRRYSGGDLEAFIQLTRLLLAPPVSLALKNKHGEESFLLGSKQVLNYHAAVIINKSTRMYGELLALLLHRYARDRVTLLGMKTRGFIFKIKQFPLEDGSSILLPEGYYLLAGKNLVQTGITPDVTVEEKQFAKIHQLAIDTLLKTHD